MAQDFSKEYASIRLLFQSPFILILIFIGLLFVSSNKAFYLGLFGIVLSRNLIVFLTAPEPQFKYYGTFIFPVVFLIYLVRMEMVESIIILSVQTVLIKFFKILAYISIIIQYKVFLNHLKLPVQVTFFNRTWSHFSSYLSNSE